MSHRQEKAVDIANAYSQGDIAGLDDAMTRRLIASTVLTESNGGDLDITNSLGFVGRYQAGASWLADAGYVDRDKLHAAMARDGFTRESKWGAKGHMTEFLNDSANWKNSLSLDQYKASAELQDRAFKIISDKAYNQAISEGVLSKADDPATVAGFLKARHISGPIGARKALDGVAVSDDYQTSNIKYMEDITRNGDGLDQLMGRVPQQRSQLQANLQHSIGALHQGAHGEVVRKLQTDLAALGYTNNRGHALQPDGHYGPNTEAAVRAFQSDHGLLSDGIAGKRTLEAIHGQRQLLNDIPALASELDGRRHARVDDLSTANSVHASDASSPLRDFSARSHPQNALYNTLKAGFPPDTTPEWLAHATAACYMSGIKQPDDLGNVYGDGGKIMFMSNSLFARSATVDTTQPPRTVQQTLQHVQQHDQQQAQMMSEIHARNAQVNTQAQQGPTR